MFLPKGMPLGIKHLKDCREFVAGDGSILRELLHPEKADLQIHYSLAYAKVMAGEMTKPHKLKSSEIYYIIAGQGLMHIDEESFEVNPECAVYVPPHSTQYIENSGSSDLKFLCIVEPAWRKEDEEVFE
jgi:mannose-6-phosphate isomerase-like protein (cupin superfamily)